MLLLTLTLINCQKEDDLLSDPNQKQEINQKIKATTKTVSAADIPEIMNLIKSKSNSKLEFDFGGQENYAAAPSGGESHETNLTITQVMTDEIMASTLNGITNYAFQMTTNSNDYVLNLVVKEWYGVNVIYFSKYVPSTNLTTIDFTNFTGDIYYYDETGVYQAKVAIVGGANSSNITYDAPCPDSDGDPIDPDGNDGSGSGSGGGGSSGGGDCFFEVVVSINQCGGDNSGTEHTIESCGGDGTGGIVTTTFTWTCNNSQSAPPPEEIFFDPPCSNNGSGGSGGLPDTNSCPGVTPCADELQSFDENCVCTFNFNPVTPVNNTTYTVARQKIKECIGMYGSNYLDNNSSVVYAISDYLDANDCSLANQNFLKKAIDAWENNDFSELFALDVFNQDPYDVWKRLSQAEKDLIKEFPFIAYGVFKNREIAVQETITRFGNVIENLNGKPDAFRHAYYNVINAKVVGIDMAKLFSDAHESETPVALALEKQMDLFNNNIGHQSISGNGSLSLSQLADLIYQKLLNGDLRYLNPIDYNDPNFWDNPNTPETDDGNHGITSSTQLIPTDQ